MNVLGISSNTYNILATLFKHFFCPKSVHTHTLEPEGIYFRLDSSRGLYTYSGAVAGGTRGRKIVNVVGNCRKIVNVVGNCQRCRRGGGGWLKI